MHHLQSSSLLNLSRALATGDARLPTGLWRPATGLWRPAIGNWRPFWRLAIILATAMSVTAAASGCSKPTSTLLATEDFEYMATECGRELQASMVSGFLADRGPDSPPRIIAVQSVTTYSQDIITDGERCYLMAKLRDTLNQRLRREKNITFVMSADKLREAKKLGRIEDDAMPDRAPTDVMDGRLRSIDRETNTDQASAYLFEAEIKDLSDGAVVWSGKAELKR